MFVLRAIDVEANVAPSYRPFPDETTDASLERAALRRYGVHRADDDARAGSAPTLVRSSAPQHLAWRPAAYRRSVGEIVRHAA